MIQLAKLANAKTVIAAASSSSKLEFTRTLGADASVNYTTSAWIDEMRSISGDGPDIIYESVGGAITKSCLQALAPQGELVIYGALNIQEFEIGVPELLGMIFKNQSLAGFALTPLLTLEDMKSGLKQLFDMSVKGELKVTIGGSYPLEQVGKAHRGIEERRTIGKIVLVP